MTNDLIQQPQAAQQRFLKSAADIAVYGGAAGGGKSISLLMEPLYHKDNPGFNAVLFRRTYPMVTAPGGLWDQAGRLYPIFGAVPNQSELSWTFPSGARVRFAHLQHDKNIYDWMGSEIALLAFDELTHFSEQQFWYLLSRNRSLCGIKPYVRASCNPDADSWVAPLLSWWIDPQLGTPVPERAGVPRWFVRWQDRLVWADTPGELLRQFPDLPPKSLAFFPARLSDNPALMATNPSYLGNLLALPLVERERLLGGNWKIRPTAGLVFNRDQFRLVPVGPTGFLSKVRAWDKAGTPGGGDHTAGVLIGKTQAGTYCVLDVVRGQWGAHERDQHIKATARADGPDVTVWLEQEPGSAGKQSAEISVADLAGYLAYAEPATGDKLTRARAFSAQVQAGNVSVVQAPWTEAFLAEMHRFDGRPGGQDDQVDAASQAFNKLALVSTGEWVFKAPKESYGVLANVPRGVFLS